MVSFYQLILNNRMKTKIIFSAAVALLLCSDILTKKADINLSKPKSSASSSSGKSSSSSSSSGTTS
jgi:hypothetical protein